MIITQKNTRIDVRIAPAQKDLLMYAASLSKKNLSTFFSRI